MDELNNVRLAAAKTPGGAVARRARAVLLTYVVADPCQISAPDRVSNPPVFSASEAQNENRQRVKKSGVRLLGETI